MKTWAEQQAAEKGKSRAEKDAMRRKWLNEVAKKATSQVHAAQMVGMPKLAMHLMVNRLGINMQKGSSGPGNKVSLARVKELAAMGKTSGEAAGILKCSRSTINAKAREHGIRFVRAPKDYTGHRSRGPAPTPRDSAADNPAPLTFAEYAARENRAARKAGRI